MHRGDGELTVQGAEASVGQADDTKYARLRTVVRHILWSVFLPEAAFRILS